MFQPAITAPPRRTSSFDEGPLVVERTRGTAHPTVPATRRVRPAAVSRAA